MQVPQYRHILGTGAEVLLLSATEYDGLDLHPFPYIQQSDALRSVDLVSTDGQQINVHLLGIDPGFSESLYRIHMEQRIRFICLIRAPASSMGCRAPISLFVCMIDTRMVSGVMALRKSSSRIRPQGSTGR